MPAPRSLRKSDKSSAQWKGFKCTDLGNAERFSSMHTGQVLFCHTWGKWLVWDGHRWKIDATAAIGGKAKATVRAIKQESEKCEDENIKQGIVKWAARSESKAKIDAMLGLAKSEPGIPVEPEELDRDDWLFNCRSGTINLRSGELQPHRELDRITKLVDIVADPMAKCPEWDRFLEHIMDGNSELIAFLRRAIGYSLTGSDTEQCLFLLYGTGANGKSTFLDTIKLLLGDYGKQAEFSTFLQRKNETVRNDIADLKGARFVTAIEAESGQRLAESVLKSMTGGDTLKARLLYSEYFEFRPTFKIFLAANHKPQIKGNDEGIWRRIRLIPFTVTILENERDPQLKAKLRAELPGILNWALIGCAEWQEQGLGIPDDVRAATDAYRNEMDSLSDFIEECCMLDVRCRVPKGELFEAYERWCSQNGDEPLRKRSFGIQMTERGIKEEKVMSTRYWRGIGLLDDTHGERDRDTTKNIGTQGFSPEYKQ